MEWIQGATSGSVASRTTGRSILIVSADPRERQDWADSFERAGFRPVVVQNADEAQQLLSALLVQAAVVGHIPLHATGTERSVWNRLLSNLSSMPTMIVVNSYLSTQERDRRCGQLLSRIDAPNDDDQILSTRFGVQHLASDPALRN